MLGRMASIRSTAQPLAETARRDGALRALALPTYPRFFVSGFFWNTARWLSLFTGSYLVYHQSGSTLLVQLVGAAYFAPLFVGGLAGGVVADRFDRLRVLRLQFWLLVAVALVIGVVVVAGRSQPWQIYLAMVLMGLGGVADLTCRRALIGDLTGAELLGNAFALEAINQTSGTLIGNLLGGAIINVAGSGVAFCASGLCCALAAVCLIGVRVPARARVAPARAALRAQLAEGLRYTARHRALLGLLSISVVMNVFYFTYLPLVPVFAKGLGVNAFWTGVLGSAAGGGSLLGACLIAAADRRAWRVRLYAGGVGIALSALIVFALATMYPMAFGALIVAGVGMSGFSTMQATLVLSVSEEHVRGRVMGVLSMAIGTLPLAMFALGAIAEASGPVAAVTGSGLLGLAALAACWAAGGEMRAIE
nr:MFS transporter [Dehalococcoidia bacterium]